MLTPELVDALQAPISEASPCGDDLEYDPAFMALVADAQGKPEQQFGDTVIPAVDPDWRLVSEQAEALLRRSKDLRVAMLLLRASTRQQGIEGFALGLQLVSGLLDRFWDGIHPRLDADDDNDPTMRLNALAPLSDASTLLHDLGEAAIGTARGIGPVRVRDVAVAHNLLAPAENALSPAQVQGGLDEILAAQPAIVQTLQALPSQVAGLVAQISEHTGLSDAVDVARLRSFAHALKQAAGTPGADAGDAAAADGGGSDGAPAAARQGAPGEIRSRQDALQTLDRVIRYLEQSEPGNPAPLLIERAKQLIGVSFLEIMANLAPGAMDTIETITGRRAAE